MKRVILFDVDGTLVNTGGAGRRAMERAFVRVVGSAQGLANMRFGGMTDRAIVREGLRNAGRSDGPDAIDHVLEAYLEALPAEIDRATHYQVLPGMLETLQELADDETAAIGLGTGNLEPGAKVKLAPGRLNRFFAFGGFGSDHEERSELLRTGLERGARHLGVAVDACRGVIIGDTPKDIAAAQAVGATCVAVATGSYRLEDLEGHGADAVVPDISHAAARDLLWDP